MRILHLFFALQAVGGAVRFAIGVFDRDAARVAIGTVQVMLAVLLLGVNSGDGGEVNEVRGPSGGFVIRVHKHRQWRDEKGLARIGPSIWGEYLWRASVRRRSDDPLGPVLDYEVAWRPAEAKEHARSFEARIRSGNMSSEPRSLRGSASASTSAERPHA